MVTSFKPLGKAGRFAQLRAGGSLPPWQSNRGQPPQTGQPSKDDRRGRDSPSEPPMPDATKSLDRRSQAGFTLAVGALPGMGGWWSHNGSTRPGQTPLES